VVVLEQKAEEHKEYMTNRKIRSKQLTLPDLVVLSVLSEKPRHGYELVAELEAREVKDWAAVSRPQVYYSLNKLLALKQIQEVADQGTSLGPDRTTFEVTPQGKDALTRSLSESSWAEQRICPPFLTWMALSAHLPKKTVRRLLQERKAYLLKELKREIQTQASFEGEAGSMVIAGKLMVDLTVRTFKLELDWLETAEKEMLARN
jgi:DNA-binding PadR family transcriptional regulator